MASEFRLESYGILPAAFADICSTSDEAQKPEAGSWIGWEATGVFGANFVGHLAVEPNQTWLHGRL